MSEQREKAIRERAYALWEKSGSAHGQHGEHWDQAVREIDAEAARRSESPVASRRDAGIRAPSASPALSPAAPVGDGAPAAKAAAAKVARCAQDRLAAKPRESWRRSRVRPSPPAPRRSRSRAPAKAVSKAKQAAESVVATVKRAAQGAGQEIAGGGAAADRRHRPSALSALPVGWNVGAAEALAFTAPVRPCPEHCLAVDS